ncbi:hypothetical protein VQ01_11015 [Tamlana sp. s12]|nr:hypothetical protein VQ01_11015 [Tamlana sp. s12]
MVNTGIVITLAYPDTVVRLPKEWYAPYLRFFGIGTKNYVRAGHAALVLVEKETGALDYYDFGRYIVPAPFGRVRSYETDNELEMPFKAEMEKGVIKNLDDILKYLVTHPKITHGEGAMLASVCSSVDYNKARSFILNLQGQNAVRYAAFKREASNCARFVADTLLASVTDARIRKQLKKMQRFTSSTVGNVLLSDTEDAIFKVSENGDISKFKGSQKSENLRCFLDRLKGFQPNLKGNLLSKEVEDISEKAQWLSGIGGGAWFELHKTDDDSNFRFRRISPYGRVDCDAYFQVDKKTFCYDSDYEFMPFSNCKSFQVKQNSSVYRFERVSSSLL